MSAIYTKRDDCNNCPTDSRYQFELGKPDESADNQNYDPFALRDQKKSTTNFETFVHLFKSSVGSGILAMPYAFTFAGVTTGFFLMILVSSICINCSYILVKSAHKLYRKTRKTAMSYAEVAEMAFLLGPKPLRKFGKISQCIVIYGMFSAYYGAGSVYAILVAENFKQVLEYNVPSLDMDIRIYIAILLIPIMLLCWIPNLKYLAPVSLISNVCMIYSLIVTIFYIIKDFNVKSFESVELISTNISEWPKFISTTIFAMMAIGTIMPLENNMRYPKNYLGYCGVLNSALITVSLIYLTVGLFGYVAYGEKTKAIITLSLPLDEHLAQSVKLMIGISVLLGYALVFYVCLDTLWNQIKDRIVKQPMLWNYAIRTVLVIINITIAILVPKIGPLIGLIGALCFSILGLMLPIFIEVVTFWDEGWGLLRFRTYKNIAFVAISFICLIFGTKAALIDIYNSYIPFDSIEVVNATNV